MALLGFHAASGCDNVASYYGYGKNKWYSTLKKRGSQSEEAFIALANGAIDEAKEDLSKFVVSLYSP